MISQYLNLKIYYKFDYLHQFNLRLKSLDLNFLERIKALFILKNILVTPICTVLYDHLEHFVLLNSLSLHLVRQLEMKFLSSSWLTFQKLVTNFINFSKKRQKLR